ncbi:replication protein A 70 kDa DNA-binding subunit B [Tanacetum coccineum]
MIEISNLEEEMRETLIYNTSFFGEYECSSLALEGRKKEWITKTRLSKLAIKGLEICRERNRTEYYNGGSGGYGGLKGFGGSGSSGGFGDDKNKKITPINDVDPMLDDISVQGRCISIWHLHNMNATRDPYSIDLVLQDAQNNRIQNGGRLLLLPHRCDWFRDCSILIFIEHANKHKYVYTSELGKVKYWDGTPAIHNALFGIKIFINLDLPEIVAFRTRIQEQDVELNNHLKKDFLADEVGDEEVDDGIDEVNMSDSSVNRFLGMKTPSKEASASGESSGAKKRCVFIDLDELDTESEDDKSNSNT